MFRVKALNVTIIKNDNDFITFKFVNNVFISGKKELAEFFNRSLVHIVNMVDGYIISVAYGVYGNVRLQRKMKKKKHVNDMLLDY